MAKSKKPQADKFEKKVAVKGTIGDVIKVALTQPPSKPVEPKEKAEKKKPSDK